MDAAVSPPAAATSEMLDNDDLLGEILLRLAFPATLVRVALVCTRWLHVASGAAFLRRFRDLHPPPLVGFYAQLNPLRRQNSPLKFVPMPNLPPELAAAARSVGAALDDAQAAGVSDGFLTGSRDGRLFVKAGFDRVVVLYPLHHPPRQAVAISEPRLPVSLNDRIGYMHEYIPGGGRGGADVCVTSVSRLSWQYQRTAVDVHELDGGGAWRNLASMELELPLSAASHLPFIEGRLYLVASASAVAAMRLASRVPADVPTIALPDGLENRYDGSYKMVVASDRSGLHLARREGYQIHVLHHRIDGGGVCDDGWTLVDTMCLREVCSGLGLEIPSLAAGDQDGVTTVHTLGDDAEFVFLQVGKDVLCVHVKSRVAEKVYTMTVEDENLRRLVPLVMPWPPIFPAVES